MLVAQAGGCQTMRPVSQAMRGSKLEANTVEAQLTWEASNEGGAQDQPRDAVPELGQEFDGVVLGRAVHAEQSEVADVLQRDVNVLAHLQATS